MNLPCSPADRQAIADDLAAVAPNRWAEARVRREALNRGLVRRDPRWVVGAALRHAIGVACFDSRRLAGYPRVGDAEEDLVCFLRKIPAAEAGSVSTGRGWVPLPEAVARWCGAIRDAADHAPLWLARLLTGRYQAPWHQPGKPRTWEARQPHHSALLALARQGFSWGRLLRSAEALRTVIHRRHRVLIGREYAVALLATRGVRNAAREFAQERANARALAPERIARSAASDAIEAWHEAARRNAASRIRLDEARAGIWHEFRAHGRGVWHRRVSALDRAKAIVAMADAIQEWRRTKCDLDQQNGWVRAAQAHYVMHHQSAEARLTAAVLWPRIRAVDESRRLTVARWALQARRAGACYAGIRAKWSRFVGSGEISRLQILQASPVDAGVVLRYLGAEP